MHSFAEGFLQRAPHYLNALRLAIVTVYEESGITSSLITRLASIAIPGDLS